MAICKRAGCSDQAVGVVLTAGKYSSEIGGRAMAVEDHCRPHHIEERRLAGAVVSCEMVETLPENHAVVDIDGSEKRLQGERVDIDGEEHNVDNLVNAGLVRRLDAPSLADSLAAEEEALAQRLADTKARRAEADKVAKAEAAEQAKAEKAAKTETDKA